MIMAISEIFRSCTMHVGSVSSFRLLGVLRKSAGNDNHKNLGYSVTLHYTLRELRVMPIFFTILVFAGLCSVLTSKKKEKSRT